MGDLVSLAITMIILIVGGLGMARRGPFFVLILLLIAGYFAGWIKLRFNSWVGYALPDALCLILVIKSLTLLSQGKAPWPRNGVSKAIVILTAFCLLEFLNPQAPLIRSLAGFRAWLFYTFLFFSGYSMLQTRQQFYRVYTAIIILTMITGLYGLVQWRLGPEALLAVEGTSKLAQYGRIMAWKDEATGTMLFRAFSTFVAPGVFGTNMVMGLIIAVAVVIARGIPGWMRWVSVATIPIAAAGAIVTGSRTAVVIAAMGLIILLMLRRGRAVLITVLITPIAVWSGVSLTTTLFSARYATILDMKEFTDKWQVPLFNGMKIAADNPVGMGLGFTAGMPSLGSFSNNNLMVQMGNFNVDSGVGAAAAELGFAGLIIYVYLLLMVCTETMRAWLRIKDPLWRDALLAPVVMSVLFAASAVIWPMAASLPYSIYFWALLGMAFRAEKLALAPRDVVQPPVEPDLPPRWMPSSTR